MRPTVCLCGRLIAFASLSVLVIAAALADEPLNSWTWRNPLPQGNVLNGVTHANGQFVAVGMGGSILTSPNGVQWDVRASGVTNNFYGITYGLNRYWAVGDRGLVLSSPDGIGWTNQAAGTTNGLYDIAFVNNRLVAVGSLGTIGVSQDGSAWTWTTLGNSNTLFGVAWGNGVYVAVGRTNTPFGSVGGLALSSPDAMTWTVRSQDQSVLPLLGSVAYGNGLFVARGQNNALMVSSNGIAWNNLTGYLKPPYDTVALGYFGTQFIALDTGGTAHTSTNGSNWTATVGTAFMSMARGLAWNNQTYVMVGGAWNGNIATGTNQSQFWYWTTRNTGFTDSIYGLLHDGRRLVGVGPLGKAYASDDGCRWTISGMGTNVYFNDVAFGRGRYVSVGRDGWIVTSTNGTEWAPVASTTSNRLESVAFANDRFLAIGWPKTLVVSEDGLSWTNRSPAVTYTIFHALAYANGLYVVTANAGRIYTSPDLDTWTERVAHTNLSISLNGVVAGNGLLVAVGQLGAIVTSTNGVNWQIQASPTSNGLVRVVYGGRMFVATGAGGTVLTSPDGTTWTARLPVTTETLEAAALVAGRWVVAGYNGVVLQSDPLATLNLRAASGIELTVGGQPGLMGRLEYTDVLGTNANWQLLTPLSLSNSPSVWMDYPVPNIAGRFYRAVLGR